MELSLANRQWVVCIQASLVGFIIFSIFVNQGWQPSSLFTSLLRPPESPRNDTKLSHMQDQSPTPSPGPSPQLSPQPVAIMPPMQTETVTASPVVSVPVMTMMAPMQSEIETAAPAPAIPPSYADQAMIDAEAKPEKECDIFDGKWVYDEKAYPLYQGRRCPVLSDQVACQKNGRPDSAYQHWRWEANGCEIPRFNGTDMLERLRGKRMIIVGDSLNRNQWESLTCMLYSSTPRKKSVFKSRPEGKVYHALDYNCTVEFYWTPFLIPMEGASNQPKVLKLDKLPPMSKKWVGADVMVFNTGHWWTHRGHFQKWTYLEHKGELLQTMEGNTAFETAMRTWAAWVDRWVDPTKTTVFFRSVSPEHKNKHWCYNQTSPITDESYIQYFPRSLRDIVEKTILEMKTPVKLLNITRMSEFRRDAHTGIYTTRAGKLLTPEQRAEPNKFADCSHWCLPGLPDAWNVIIYAFLTGWPAVTP